MDVTVKDEIKMEIDDDSIIYNFVAANMISHDTTVTCGKCKKEMNYEEYNVNHRSLHYNLCWLDGIEDEIDFTNTSKINEILQNFTNHGKTKIQFKCDWCDEIKIAMPWFIKHIQNCQSNPVWLSANDTVSKQSKINCSSKIDTHKDDSVVSCGRCGKSMSYAEYANNHIYIHYNLCWLDGEDQLDYADEKNIINLLRKVLPKNAALKKKVTFRCEWCSEVKKSVVGFAKHVKNCTTEHIRVASPSEKLSVEKESELNVTCGLCQKTMFQSEYENIHKWTHYNLSWLDDNEKPDFNDENCIARLLRKTVPYNAPRKKTIRFVCEWCKKGNKSVIGFASHIKQCKLRPDKVFMSNEIKCENNSNISTEMKNLESMVTCGRCNMEMSRREYYSEHSSKHLNLCWIDGEEKLDLGNYDIVFSKVKECISFKTIRSRNVKLTCDSCKTVKKSVPGFASHVVFCSKSSVNTYCVPDKCEDCGKKIKPSSMTTHKLKFCKGVVEKEISVNSIKGRSFNENTCSSQKLRQKKRLPNILTFHPDTKYAPNFYDCICQLCDYVAPNINDFLNHILIVHSIDINHVDKNFMLKNCLLNTYDVHKSIFLKPLLNYYNFFKKVLWTTANNHSDFQMDIKVLNTDEAVKYLPLVQESCKIFNSDDEEISIELFKSTHVNDMYWLFTGGPIWAMSWCPVPEEVQTQYLAISCHPKPDMEHKEMTIYKYPSLVQLWNFNSLNNINCDSICDFPYMAYGLAHEFGAVWDMEWCPSGAYEPNKKIGLLALSTSTGDCPIFAMPYVDGNSEMFYIYKAKSVVARNFQCEWTEVGVQCTKVCWNKVSPFNTLICGYSNGTVSVFVINFKSLFFSNDVLYPSHTFRASKCGITGLSVNYFNSSILATTSVDGNVVLWDLKSTEYPIFQKKFFFPSDCAWLHQCHTLVFCTNSVNPNLLRKVQTINFSIYDDDIDYYNPELHVCKNLTGSTKVINAFNVMNNGEKLNCKSGDDRKMNIDDSNSGLDNSNVNSDDELFKTVGSSKNSDIDPLKNYDDEDWFGPFFLQKCVHWSISGSNWMNAFATGDANGVFYEKLLIPENNRIKKENCTTRQLMVRKLSSDTPQPEFGPKYKETVKKFGLELRVVHSNEDLKNDPDDKPLLRYPLDSITRVSWNQNFNSFRWLAIGTQSGFSFVSPSQTIPDSAIKSFYKIVSYSD